MQKKTTDTLTMTRNERHIGIQTDFVTRLTRNGQQCTRAKTEMTIREEKRKGSRFAFLKISVTAHCTHLQSRTSRPATQALQKSAVLPQHSLYAD